MMSTQVVLGSGLPAQSAVCFGTRVMGASPNQGQEKTMDQLVKHVAAAASAHGVCGKVFTRDEIIDDHFTGNIIVTVEIFQEVWFAPEGQAPSQIDNRRLIGISRGDAKRLFNSRSGRAGGQAYTGVRAARREFHAIAEQVSQAATELMSVMRSGALRETARDVANEACQIEMEMRQKLQGDLAALSGQKAVEAIT
jgi:hypothetical protein